MLTYLAFRRQGFGSRLVSAATAFIRDGDADVGLFTCQPHLRDYYAAHGWIPIERAVLLGGPRTDPSPSDGVVMMGFFSEKGRQGREAFTSHSILFDDDPWSTLRLSDSYCLVPPPCCNSLKRESGSLGRLSRDFSPRAIAA
ncbi:MAG TPA: hypothetical protein VGR22_08080 [Thermomicrobiales bacterium]|nr:hypothetical protein [Thermomicrobiales bacterium]